MSARLIIQHLYFTTIVILVISCLWALGSEDPYEILGVRRNATAPEIKQAFKRLAKVWNPDQRKDPDAERRFHEINRAYGILSDPERKSQYDRYGDNDEPKDARETEHNPFADFYFASFGQSQYQFHSLPNFFKKHDIGFRLYESTLVNKSYTKPYLIFVYTDLCQSCMRAERLWEYVVSILEPDGYGIGTINSKMEGTLVDRLRIRQLPAVFALVDGRPIHFRGRAIETKGLLEFAGLVLPKMYVTTLNDGNFMKFFEDSRRGNKVAAVMCGMWEEPDQRTKLAAMRSRSMFTFGWVSTTAGAVAQFVSTYRVSPSGQTFMLFKERTIAPAARVQSDEVSAVLMNSVMQSDQYLILPRLSSQHYLDALCPQRQLCVVLLARATWASGDDGRIAAFRDGVADKSGAVKKVRYVYVYDDRQMAFVQSLSTADPERESSSVIGDRCHVVLLWREDSTRARVSWLRHIWSGRPETVNRSADLVLAKVDAVANDMDSQTRSWQLVTLKPLVTEDNPAVYKRLATKVFRSWETFLHHVGKDEFLPAISVLGTLVFMIVIGYWLNRIVDTEKKEEEERKRRRERGKPIEDTKEFKTLIRELRAETYFGMVRMLKPGFRSIVVLVDAETKDVLVKQFGRAIWPWRRNKTILFGYVVVEKNLDWFRQLLELALADPDLRLKQAINPRNVIGTVLSLNGFRQFFSMYHPKHAPSMVGFKAAERRRTQESRNFLNLASSDENTDEDELEETEKAKREGNENAKEFLKTKTLKMDELLDGLPNWLDRLFRGNAQRYYISEWPPIR